MLDADIILGLILGLGLIPGLLPLRGGILGLGLGNEKNTES